MVLLGACSLLPLFTCAAGPSPNSAPTLLHDLRHSAEPGQRHSQEALLVPVRCIGTVVREGGPHQLPSARPPPLGRAGEEAAFQAGLTHLRDRVAGRSLQKRWCPGHTPAPLNPSGGGWRSRGWGFTLCHRQACTPETSRRGGAGPRPQALMLKLNWPEKPVPV